AAGPGAARPAAVHARDLRSRSVPPVPGTRRRVRAVLVRHDHPGPRCPGQPAGRARAPGQLRGPRRAATAGPAPAGALRRPAGHPPGLARPRRAPGTAAASPLDGPAARPDPRADPRVRAGHAAALRRLVVIVPWPRTWRPDQDRQPGQRRADSPPRAAATP